MNWKYLLISLKIKNENYSYSKILLINLIFYDIIVIDGSLSAFIIKNFKIKL